MAVDGNDVSVGILVEELEVLGETGAEGFDGLLEQLVVALRLLELLSFALEGNLHAVES